MRQSESECCLQVGDKEPGRAALTVPKGLCILPSKIGQAGLGVWTSEAVPRRVRYGPYEGSITPLTKESGYGWVVSSDVTLDASRLMRSTT